MAILHVQQIRGHLEKTFAGLIEMSDYATASPEQRGQVFLTRSLAAFAIMHLADITPQRSAAAVTDGTGDNGVDAIYFDEVERRLYIVQSKWASDGKGSVERGDIQKFITGIHDLINTRFERFNSRVQAKQGEVEAAVFDATTKIVAVVAHTGQDPLAKESQQDLDDLLVEMNQPTETIEVRVLRQINLHGVVAGTTTMA